MEEGTFGAPSRSGPALLVPEPLGQACAVLPTLPGGQLGQESYRAGHVPCPRQLPSI